MRGSREPPESLARGTLSEGFPTNVGDLLVSIWTEIVPQAEGDRRVVGRVRRGLTNQSII